MAIFPTKPYVDSAPVTNEPPVATDWGMIVRPIGGSTTIEQPSLSTVTAVPLTLVSSVLQAANTRRRGLIIGNGTTQILYVKIGAGASLIDYSFQICPGGYWEAPFPSTTQLVSGIWASPGTGDARITELTVP